MATRTPLLNYYDILGLPRDASAADIEAAFRTEMLKVRDLAGSGERTRQIGLAYRALSNPERRRDYDAALSGLPPPAPDQAFAEPHGTEGSPAPLADPYEHAEPDEDRPGRAAGRALVFSLLAGALLLLAGLWLSGLFSSDPQVAEQAPGTSPVGKQPGGEVFASARENNSLADALASILPSGSDEAEEAAAQNGSATTEVASADTPAAASAAAPGEAPPADPGADGADDSAGPEPAAQEPTGEPAPERQAETPQPSPPAPAPVPVPAVDRSAGPRLLSGGLVDADNQGGRFQGSVSVRLRVGSNGRAQGCRVTRPSGDAALDATTCRLLQERLVFNPARDRQGNPVATEVESTHVWGRQQRRR